MPLTVDWVKQNIAGDIRLTAAQVGLGPAGTALFGDRYLGADWKVAHTHHDGARLVLWGTASVGGRSCAVEIRFRHEAGAPDITGLEVYAAQDGWESPLLDSGPLTVLRDLGLTGPEVVLRAPASRWDPTLEVCGAARLAPANPPEGANRLVVRGDTPGFSAVRADFAAPAGRSGLGDLLALLPFRDRLPAAALPDQVADLVTGDFALTGLELGIDHAAKRPVSGTVRIAVGLKNPVVSTDLFTLITIVLVLEVQAKSFAVAAEFSGTIGGIAAVLQADYRTGGGYSVAGAVDTATLPAGIRTWIRDNVGHDLGSVLDQAHLSQVFVRLRVDGAVKTLEAGFTANFDVAGRDALLAVRGRKPDSGEGAVIATLEYPAPGAHAKDRRMLFEGSVVSAKGEPLRFAFAWASPEGVRFDEIAPVPN
ncbi:hypothetical protein [Embleya sp. NPDC020630]|uniref:hypothetical protein n=1 Tax=Embleya sp. NPDC020630 TaxID=3363979 RepID=UPI00378F045E